VSALVGILLPATTAFAGTLSVLSAQNRYFDDGSGKGIYMTGSHHWANLQDSNCDDPPTPVVTWSDDLDFLDSKNHKFIRGWMDEKTGHPQDRCNGNHQWKFPLVYQRTGPGNANDGKSKFDLTKFETSDYFGRLDDRIGDCADQQMYISIMLFQGWSVDDKDQEGYDPFTYHPFNIDNNINSIDGDQNNDGLGLEVHTLDYSAITTKQEDYVEKAIDELNGHDNMIWQISNESHEGSVSWQYYWIDYIKSYEAAYKTKQHLVWMEGYEIPNSDLFASNADVISPNKFNGDDHYRGNPKKNNTGKIVILDTDHLWGIGGNANWVWQAFTRGYHPIFMDVIYTEGWDPEEHEPIRDAMGVTRILAERLDFSVCVPYNGRANSSNCITDSSDQYLAYQRDGADLTIKPLASGEFYYQWVDYITGEVLEQGCVTGTGANKTLTNPSSTHAALYLVRVDDAVSNDLGEYNDPRGLIEDPTPPSTADTEPATIGGRDCRTNKTLGNDQYIYLKVNNDWAFEGDKTEVWITMEYYDNGTSNMNLKYDGTGGTWTVAFSFDKTDTNTWKSITQHVTDAYFGNRQNSGNDMRIAGGSSAHFYVDKVTVSEYDPSPGPPDEALDPNPVDSATGIALDADLSWTAGSGATSHDVYFGTDSTPDSGEFKGNQSGVTYEPGTLSANTTYYWRIDEVNQYGTTTGPVWSFTTYGSPGAAHSPDPANSATSVSTTATLSWAAGNNAESHDVYFGTDSTPDAGEFQGNQATIDYDPGTLSTNTTYYWRIDEKNQAGTTTGSVWSFTTTDATVTTLEIKEAGAITVDASSSDWNLSAFTTNVRGGQIESGDIALTGYDSGILYYAGKASGAADPTSASDHTVKVYARHDFNYQYFLARVDDDDIQTDEGTQGDNWLNDCVEIYLDPSHNHGSSMMSDSTSDIQLVIDAANRQNVYMCTSGYATQILNGVTSSVSTDGTGWWLEVRIDKTALDPDLPDTGSIGIDFNFRDNDDNNNMDKTTVYTWADDSGSGFPSKIPDNWGDAELDTVVGSPGQASSPDPANSSTGVSITADLSWTAGNNATSHDVYFGTSSPGTFQGNQSGTTYDPGTMTASTTYYWRIDEVNSNGTTTGTVWSFTTGSSDYNDSEFVSWTIPDKMAKGQTYTVDVTFKNTGTKTWAENVGEGHKLGAYGDSDPFISGVRVNMDIDDTCAPNDQYTWTFEMDAPSTTGTYYTDWQVLEELVEWFGEIEGKYVEVLTEDNVTVDLGSTDVEDGLKRPNTEPGDGDTISRTKDSVNCRRNSDRLSDHYIYFQVDNDYAYQGDRSDVYITIDWYDNTSTGIYRLQYDGASASYTNASPDIDCDNTDTWYTFTWHVTDAYFGNRQNRSSDFRIHRSDDQYMFIDEVEVSNVPPHD
jgi:hypothetical protein